jgi:hypothetical protein
VVGIKTGIDAHRHADEQREQGGAERKLEGRRHAFQDQAADRLGGAVGQAEIAARCIVDEAGELDRRRIVQTQLGAQLIALFHGRVLADHGVDWIADVAKQREGDKSHRQQHGDGLQESSQDEGKHFWSVGPGAALAGLAPKRNARFRQTNPPLQVPLPCRGRG